MASHPRTLLSSWCLILTMKRCVMLTINTAHLSSLVSLFSLGAGLDAVLALEMTVAGRARVRITSPDEPRSVVTLLLLLFACWSLAR
jgi:hypothetical protein